MDTVMNILTLNKISACGTSRFDAAKYTVGDAVENPDGIMVRSAAMHEMELPASLAAIARAVPASTTFRSTSAARRASWYSTRRVPTPTRLKSW